MSTNTFQIGSTFHELTPWLGGDEHPAREGVYRRQFPAGPYSCWDGDSWLQDANTPQAAAAQVALSPYQSTPWRGLTESSGLPCAGCPGVTDRGADSETGADLVMEFADG